MLLHAPDLARRPHPRSRVPVLHPVLLLSISRLLPHQGRLLTLPATIQEMQPDQIPPPLHRKEI
jgi:hypothetical protein